jgi:hypothetical protein
LELALVLDGEMGKVQWSDGVMEEWIYGKTGAKNYLICLD